MCVFSPVCPATYLESVLLKIDLSRCYFTSSRDIFIICSFPRYCKLAWFSQPCIQTTKSLQLILFWSMCRCKYMQKNLQLFDQICTFHDKVDKFDTNLYIFTMLLQTVIHLLLASSPMIPACNRPQT